MSRLILHMSTSLGGFISGPGDDMDDPFGTALHLRYEVRR
jgi:hypothetical protein